MPESTPQRIVVGITGASGSLYAKRLLHHLQRAQQQSALEVGVVLSRNARTVWEHELQEELRLPFPEYDRQDYRAPFASGSAQYRHMVIIPCSMGTLGRIAHGLSEDLLTRAADVMLKERRQLIVVIRESPYNKLHLENMLRLADAGALILPATPSFYSRPESLDDLADTVVSRVLDHLNHQDAGRYRWGTSETDQ